MVAGTLKLRQYYHISEIAKHLATPVKENILGYHALTGCDATSAFRSLGERTCRKVSVANPDLLWGVGRDGPFAAIH